MSGFIRIQLSDALTPTYIWLLRSSPSFISSSLPSSENQTLDELAMATYISQVKSFMELITVNVAAKVSLLTLAFNWFWDVDTKISDRHCRELQLALSFNSLVYPLSSNPNSLLPLGQVVLWFKFVNREYLSQLLVREVWKLNWILSFEWSRSSQTQLLYQVYK